MHLPKIILFIGLLTVASSTTQAKPNFSVHSYFEGGLNIVDGFSQIPSATIPATPGRPTFAEQDIDSDLYFGLGFDLKYDDLLTYLHYQHLTPSNTSVLTANLNTLGQDVFASDTFSMHSHYKWFSLGFGKQYTMPNFPTPCMYVPCLQAPCLYVPCLRITPMIDLNWVYYEYKFSASGGQAGTKDLGSEFTARVGLQFDYDYCNTWSSRFTAMGSPPFLSLNIYEIKFSVAYHLYEKNNFRIRPYAGIGWLWMDINNDQSELNLHTRYEAKPSLFVGFNFLM